MLYVLNLNSLSHINSRTPAIPVGSNTSATVQGQVNDGTWAAAIVTVQRSNDGFTWNTLASSVTLTAAGMTARVDLRGFEFFRLATTTVEGGTSLATFNVHMTDEREIG